VSLFISCREVTELLTEASEGTLHGWKKLQVKFHMGVCKPCQCYRSQVETTVATLHAMPRGSAPDELKRSLVEQLRASKKA